MQTNVKVSGSLLAGLMLLATLSGCAGETVTEPESPEAAESSAIDSAPVAADASLTPAASNGKCYTNWHTSKQVNMWCDGKGPERYAILAVCTSGSKVYQYSSPGHPWFGDRRGATATCKKGNLTNWWGYPVN